MDVDIDKIVSLLERVTSGNAGKVDLNYYPERKACTITWERPKNLAVHESWKPRIGMLLYVKSLLMDAGVGVRLNILATEEGFLPED